MVVPGRAAARTRENPDSREKIITRPKNGKLDLKMKVLVVEDRATMGKMIRNYLKGKGAGNKAPSDENIVPQAIFWLKK